MEINVSSDNWLVIGKRIKPGAYLELPDGIKIATSKNVKKNYNLVAEYSSVKEDMKPDSWLHNLHGKDSHCGGPRVIQ